MKLAVLAVVVIGGGLVAALLALGYGCAKIDAALEELGLRDDFGYAP